MLKQIGEKWISDIDPNKLKNCECCLASYSPYKVDEVDDFWCEVPLRDNQGRIIEPKGLCGSCNPKSYINYNPPLKCHNENVVSLDEPCPVHDFMCELYSPCCRNCGALESVYERWKLEGKDYRGHSILLDLKN